MTAAQLGLRAGARRWPVGSLRGPARLIGLELRRSTMAWSTVPLALLFWLTAYRKAMSYPPLWGERATVQQFDSLIAFAPFVAGVAAWMGSRDARRGVRELVTTGARSRWSGQLATWLATTGWAVGTYLACVGVLYGVTATQATGGAPLWWPVVVVVAGLAALSALGFAAGVLVPSRYTAPLAAIAAFVVVEAPYRAQAAAANLDVGNTYALVLPTARASHLPLDLGLFHPFLADLSIDQLLFLGGVLAVALGVLGLPRAAGGLWLRAAAGGLALAGLAAAALAVGLAGSATLTADGASIPALHSTAEDRALTFTPSCSSGAVPVCVNPAFRGYLSDLSTALSPLLSQVAGISGAPVRAEQVGDPTLGVHTRRTADLECSYTTANGEGHAQLPVGQGLGGASVAGSPLVLSFFLDAVPGTPPGTTAGQFIAQARLAAVQGITGGGLCAGGPAQLAIQGALLVHAGGSIASLQGEGPIGTSTLPAGVRAAAGRFAALPASERRSWLATHLAALRAGDVALRQVP